MKKIPKTFRKSNLQMKMMEKGMKKIYTADLIDNDLEDSGSEPDNE